MVIVESAITHRVFKNQIKGLWSEDFDRLTIGLGKGAASAMVIYLILKLLVLADGDNWEYLNTPYGYWFLLELFGFVLLPVFLFISAARNENAKLARFAGF